MDTNPVDPFTLRPMKGRKSPPSHFLLKIKSFSLLSKASVEEYSSEEFEAGGYKWNLSIYPTGKKKDDGQDHISIYLVLRETNSFSAGWEVNAIVNFFAYNFLQDEYVTTQDGLESVRRFHLLKTSWGMPKFIDLDTFKDPSNGYLIDDTCVFGAEIFIVTTMHKGDCLSVIDEPLSLSHSWKLANFSFLNSEMYESETFVAGNYKWRLRLYPDGNSEGKGNSISLFIILDVSTLPPKTKLSVDYIVRARDQTEGQHAEVKGHGQFSSAARGWGSRQLVPSAKFKDPNRGFLVGDTCILEADFKVLGLLTPLAN